MNMKCHNNSSCKYECNKLIHMAAIHVQLDFAMQFIVLEPFFNHTMGMQTEQIWSPLLQIVRYFNSVCHLALLVHWRIKTRLAVHFVFYFYFHYLYIWVQIHYIIYLSIYIILILFILYNITFHNSSYLIFVNIAKKQHSLVIII